MNAAILLASTFALVFALGLQSQFVNQGHYLGAFCNSLLISFAQLGALQVVHTRTPLDIAAYVVGGPLGIVASMLVFRRYFRRAPR